MKIYGFTYERREPGRQFAYEHVTVPVELEAGDDIEAALNRVRYMVEQTFSVRVDQIPDPTPGQPLLASGEDDLEIDFWEEKGHDA